MPQQYALVPRSKPLRLPLDEAAATDHNKRDVNDHDDNDGDVLRLELAAIYQSFAEMFPNPRLIEEMREQDQLWAAALAADSARRTALQREQGQPLDESSTKQRGFFSRLLFGSGKKSSQLHANPATSNLKVEDVLEFIEEEGDQETLCGTQFSLDATCIPQEAYARARFHAACSFRRQLPNIVRNATKFSKTSTTTLVITGLGSILEFQPSSNGDGAANEYVAQVKQTADREDLHDFMAEALVTFDLSHARAALVGENLLAISWGLIDGVVVLYRRLEFPTLPEVGWEPVAVTSPAPAVIRNMTGADDFLHEETETNLLRVTDMLPLVVDGPAGVGGPPAAACLAIGRLGGYIELVPLPLSFWWGPTLTPKNHKRPSASRKRKRKRKPTDPVEHYALGKLVDVGTMIPAVFALTTCDYHVDLICLQVYRTSVSLDTEWDKTAFPNSPPAEFVLSACGGRDGRETMTFWAVSTVFAEDDVGKDQGIGFSVHAILLEAIDIGPVGADITIFANDATMKHWRKPRQVELKAVDAVGISTNKTMNEDERSKGTHRVTTISMSAPVVTMRFDTSSDDSNNLLLAVLDWNGGVCILDCSRVVRLASQTLSQEEYEAMHNQPEDADPIPLVTMLCNRSKVKTYLSSKNNMDVDWLPLTGHDNDPGVNARLIVFSKHPDAALQALDIKTIDSQHPSLIRSTFVEMPSHLWVAFTGYSNPVGTLSFVSRKRQKKANSSAFFLCSMQTVEAKSVVESLFRSGKFLEAIDASKGASLSEDIINVIDVCHKRLWEQTREVRHLEAIADDSYVVEQTLSLLENDATGLQVDIDTVRTACLLALKRAENARLALALKLGGADGTKTIASKLRHANIKLGTYQLLCRHLRVNGTFQSCQRDFWGVSLVDLGRAFARGADISALTIIVFRHKQDIGSGLFDILRAIPVTVSPLSYLHVLPVVSEDKEMKALVNDGCISLIGFSQLPEFMFKADGLAMVVDADDEKLVLQENAVESDSEVYASRAVEFYLSRARIAHQFLGDLQAFAEFCEIGLRAFGAEPVLHGRDGFEKVPVIAKDLHLDCAIAMSLYRASLAVGDPIQRRLPGRESVHIDALRKMSVDEITSLILDGVDHVKVAAAIENHLRPLISALTGSQDIDDKLDDSIVSYYSSLVGPRRLQGSSKNESDIWALRNRLATCGEIARASSSATRKGDRIIKDKRKLSELIRSSVIWGIRGLEETEIRAEVFNDIVDQMWGMYESLPSRIPPSEATDDSFIQMHKRIDTLFRVLVGVDIVLRWPRCNCLESLAKLLEATESNGVEAQVGLRIVSEILRCFCAEVGKKSTNGIDRKLGLVQDIISDVNEINAKAFKGVLPISTLTDKIMVKPLLSENHFSIIAEVVSRFPQQWIDRSQLIGSVRSFVTEAVAPPEREFSSGVGRTTVHAVMACQDILGPVLPELQPEFQSIRRELDALHFIDTVLLRDMASNKTLGLHDLKTKLPMDVVESVLMLNPQCIIHGCTEWADPKFASQTNARIRERANTSGSPSHEPGLHPQPLPLLPGGAIFQLATVLGLDDPPSVIVVKSRVVHYGLVSRFFGASAAICRTLLEHDKALGHGGPSDVLRLRAVAETIGNESYADHETKFELCGLALKLFRGTTMPYSVRGDFDVILRTFRSLEQRRMATGSKKGSDFAVDRIYHDIKAQYSTDIRELFSTLAMNASSCVVDDTLLNALCRFVIFWCIADCTNARAHDYAQALYVQELLALGASLLMHLYNTPIANTNLDEFRGILSSQMSAHHASPDRSKQNKATAFDPSVVRKLRGRGYSENGARRAAMMSNNDFDKALTWAVSHSLDPSFDEPIVILKSRRIAPAVDRAGALLVEETLAYAQKVMEGSGSIRNLKPAPSTASTTQTSTDADHKESTRLSTKSKDSLSEESHLKIGLAKTVRKVEVIPKSTKTATNARKLLTPSQLRQNGPPPTVATPEVKILAPSDHNKAPVVEPRRNSLTQPEPELDRARHSSTTTSHSSTNSHEQGFVTPQKSASTDSPPDRAVLRQQGQAVRQQAQNITASVLSADERRRLIEQGRRLLQKAREARNSSPSASNFSTPSASARASPTTSSTVPSGAANGTTPKPPAPPSAPDELDQSNIRQVESSLDRDYHDSKSGEAEGWDWDI